MIPTRGIPKPYPCQSRAAEALAPSSPPWHTNPNTHLGVYLMCTALNHSCTPNAVVTFHGPVLQVRAAKDIRQGEEVCVVFVFVFVFVFAGGAM